MILKVHQSNFYMDGFVASAATEELARLARERGVPLVEDLGSGHVGGLDGVEHAGDEPTPAEVIAAGVDLVVFSGDKLFGGPQAGVIAGRAGHVSALKRNPLFRALRCDKLVLAALEATVDLHLTGTADEVPVLAMARISCDGLRERAERLADGLGGAAVRLRVVEAESRIGGGSLPRTVIPSVALELTPERGNATVLAARLRRGEPPVVGYVAEGGLRIDLRTVFPRQDDALLAALRAAVIGLEG
jgi:L-seryl-tRNA(Ser) seleniumtransferase